MEKGDKGVEAHMAKIFGAQNLTEGFEFAYRQFLTALVSKKYEALCEERLAYKITESFEEDLVDYKLELSEPDSYHF